MTQLHAKQVFRVLRKAFADAPLNGEGAFLYGGRWSSVGTRLAYTSEHQSLAMLEYFVHLDAEEAPADLILVTVEIPDDIPRQRISLDKLPAAWRRSPAPAELAGFGDDLVHRSKHCILIVPSALVPGENNWLLNPQHPAFRKVAITAIESLNYDPRMFPPSRPKRHKR